MQLNIFGRSLRVEFAAPRPQVGEQVRITPQPWAIADIAEAKLLKDDSVGAVARLFCDVVFGSGIRWVGADAERLSDLTDEIIRADGWQQTLRALTSVVFTRFACIEIVWSSANGRWLPARLRHIPNTMCALDIDEYGSITSVQVSSTGGLQALPRENMILHRNNPTFEKPTGISVFDDLEEVIQMKRRADLALIRYIERYAAPTVIGWYSPGTSKSQQSALLTALKSLQSASVGTLPGPKGDQGNNIELLEASGGANSAIGSAIEMLRMYERRIARGVLGSVLAIFESEFGTRAQAETHLEVLKAVVRSHQGPVEEAINRQLVAPTLAYNVGDADLRFELVEPDFADREKVGRWVADLAQAGVIDLEADRDSIRGLFGLV